MNTNVTVRMMAVNYDCVHEDLIQSHSTDIQSLKTRADYKDKRLDAMDNKLEKMNDKLDKMNENINKLILNSNSSDQELELRLKTIETELSLQKETAKNNHQQQQANYTKLATIGGIVSIGLVVLDLFLKYGLK